MLNSQAQEFPEKLLGGQGLEVSYYLGIFA
jgi:hypothetical protein